VFLRGTGLRGGGGKEGKGSGGGGGGGGGGWFTKGNVTIRGEGKLTFSEKSPG